MSTTASRPDQPAGRCTSMLTIASDGSDGGQRGQRVREIESAWRSPAPARARPARRNQVVSSTQPPTTTMIAASVAPHPARRESRPEGDQVEQHADPARTSSLGRPGDGHRDQDQAQRDGAAGPSAAAAVARLINATLGAFEPVGQNAVEHPQRPLGAEAIRATSRSTRSRLPAPAHSTTGTPCSRSRPSTFSRSRLQSRVASGVHWLRCGGARPLGQRVHGHGVPAGLGELGQHVRRPGVDQRGQHHDQRVGGDHDGHRRRCSN